jgi:hypothetical protein
MNDNWLLVNNFHAAVYFAPQWVLSINVMIEAFR